MDKGIELYLISGALGAGKTTFLKRLLTESDGRKTGVLVNEFGVIGLDGKQIDRDGISLVEINNGSIFCSCLKADFVKTLIEFSKSDIDVLFIENSGMADPSNIHTLLNELEGKCSRKFLYQGAVCLLDAVTFPKFVSILRPVQNQVASSDFIVLNKIDLVNQDTLTDIEAKVHEINPKAFIYRTMFAEVPPEIMKERLIDNGFVGETSNKEYNRPISYALESHELLTKVEVEAFAESMQPYLMRMKGFIKTQNGWLQLDMVDKFINISEIQLGKRDTIRNTKLVLIGPGPEEYRQFMENSWKKHCHGVLEVFE
ncbi:MAG: CobW family GTP-binding protein [Lachnospiraceae bacterium]